MKRKIGISNKKVYILEGMSHEGVLTVDEERAGNPMNEPLSFRRKLDIFGVHTLFTMTLLKSVFYYELNGGTLILHQFAINIDFSFSPS